MNGGSGLGGGAEETISAMLISSLSPPPSIHPSFPRFAPHPLPSPSNPPEHHSVDSVNHRHQLSTGETPPPHSQSVSDRGCYSRDAGGGRKMGVEWKRDGVTEEVDECSLGAEGRHH